MNNTTYSGHQLIDRQMPIPDQILEQAEDLTTLIDIPTYEEVYSKFHAVPAPQATVQEAPTYANVQPMQSAPSYPMGGSEQYGKDEIPFTPNVAPAQQFSYAATPPASHTAPVPPVATCPLEQYGGKFGVTVDNFPQCAGCAIWDECALAHDNK